VDCKKSKLNTPAISKSYDCNCKESGHLMRIKGWSRFQHFKDRNPPWVKLYKDILDDPDWHELDGESAKVLTMLWLIASEDETHSGLLPNEKKLSFRLRIKETQLKQILTKLSHWLIFDDINTISDLYNSYIPETETETETETKVSLYSDDFESFWKAYEKPVGKANAFKVWKTLKVNQELKDLILHKARVQAKNINRKFRKDAERWLKGRHWEDEIVPHETNQVDLVKFI